eukprot:4437049-Pyramimonas_sp.AAC.1
MGSGARTCGPSRARALSSQASPKSCVAAFNSGALTSSLELGVPCCARSSGDRDRGGGRLP